MGRPQAHPNNPNAKGRKLSLSKFIIVAAAIAVALLCALHFAALPPAAPYSPPPADPAPTTTAAAKTEAPAAKAPAAKETAPEEVHVIFSTDCSGYQHWQSIALWYSSRQAGQHGAVTRIASGCEDKKRAEIEREFREIDETGYFRVHFAPAGELKGNYKYSNKPSGLWHWLNHASPPPFVNPDSGIVVLLDPDMLILRPIGSAVAHGLSVRADNKHSMFDLDGQPRQLVGNQKEIEGLPQRVAKGFPVAQEYGIGGAWGDAGQPHARPSWKIFDRRLACGSGPCTKTTAQEAESHYSVGPPYLLHHDDARSIAEAWLRAMPGVHSQYPHLLAEMYAYAMAAANLTLPHAQPHHYMVSNTGVGAGEAWEWVDGTEVCQGGGVSTFPSGTRPDKRVLEGAYDVMDHAPGPATPSVLHFCQSYRAGGHKFGKHAMPISFFSCEGGLLNLDVAAIEEDVGSNLEKNNIKRREAFMLCNIIPRLNDALLQYKRTVCPKRGIMEWNEKPEINA